jgi:predicted DNA-binding transcriptional regulator AlpA
MKKILTSLRDFDLLPDSAHVRLPVVAALHGISRVTVWRWSKAGRLPTPVRRGGVTAWNVGALRRSMSQASA